MKRSLLLPLFLIGLVSIASSQDVFELLRKGEIQKVKELIKQSPDLVNARDTDARTLLHYAASGGDTENVEFLIAHGANLELQDARLKTPLHLAATNNRTDVVAALLKHGALLETPDDYQRTALVLCARERGQAASGRLLLDAGAEVDATDKFGDTALNLAAWRGKTDFVDLLLDRGAAVPSSGRQWQQLISISTSMGLPRLFKRLTDQGQDLTADPDLSARLLHLAAQGGAEEIVSHLLEAEFDPRTTDSFGWTPLHYAALDGRVEAARTLIAQGAPLDARTIAGQSPFNVAREREMTDVATLLIAQGADTSEAQFPLLEGPYLGQKPPGDKAELFAPGIISSIWGIHSTAVFSPDGNEVYWAPMMTFPGELYSRGGLLMMKRVDNRWTPPEWASFSGPDKNDDVPFFSMDGKIIYVLSARLAPGEEEGQGERIWYAKRTPGGWSEPQLLDPTVNKYDLHWEFSLDKRKNLYFSLTLPGGFGMGDIYCSKFTDGKYGEPVNLGKPVNSEGPQGTPFIAPDGSYLVFESGYDLVVSFRGKDGTWSDPVNLGPEVNTRSIELCPIVTRDGKYLFFISGRGGEMHPWWIGAEVIQKARAKAGEGK